MKNYLITALLAGMLFPMSAMADTPSVVSDIPTTHSLVAAVMGELGEPTLLMQSSASPHDYALRPSEAASLQAADVIFWTSSELTPWLSRAAHSLARNARSVELMKSSGTRVLGFRDSVEHTQPPENNYAQGSRDHENTDEHKHDSKEAIDPHGWLDPANAQQWLQLIATELSALDPSNARIYQDNADEEIEKIRQLSKLVEQKLGSIEQRTFIVFHDSYRYFEDRFNLHSTAAISLADGEHPGINRLSSLRDILARNPGACVFAEPQFSRRLITTISSGHDIDIGVLDPLGAQLPPGPNLYRGVIEQLANSFADCLNRA